MSGGQRWCRVLIPTSLPIASPLRLKIRVEMHHRTLAGWRAGAGNGMGIVRYAGA